MAEKNHIHKTHGRKTDAHSLAGKSGLRSGQRKAESRQKETGTA